LHEVRGKAERAIKKSEGKKKGLLTNWSVLGEWHFQIGRVMGAGEGKEGDLNCVGKRHHQKNKFGKG